MSERPSAWEALAKLSGSDWWTLAPRFGVAIEFLEWRQLTDEARAEILSWGIQAGVCAALDSFRVSHHDVISGARAARIFDDEALAKVELAWWVDQYLDAGGEDRFGPGREPRLESLGAWRLTPLACAALSRRDVDLDETPALVARLFAEYEARLDGVYWADRTAPVTEPAKHWAPRAVIFHDRLGQFDIEPYDRNLRIRDAAPAPTPRSHASRQLVTP